MIIDILAVSKIRLNYQKVYHENTRCWRNRKYWNTLRIINATNHQLPGDRESLFWVNVKAIPAMEKDQKNENTLQLAIISRIKMFYRPTHLAMAPEEAPAMLHLISVQWSHRWAGSASRYSWFRHMRRPFLLSYFLILFCQISCFQMIYMLLAVTVLLLWPAQQHSCNNHKHKKCNQYHIGFAVCSLICLLYTSDAADE